MSRVSQAQARENRERIVQVASRLFRERGVAGVSVADVMAEAGLTHGGFYKQFASKEALVAEAIGQAFAVQSERLHGFKDRTEFIENYLSPEHRDDAGLGCPSTGFGTDVARENPDNPIKLPYAEGVEQYAKWLAENGEEGLVAVSTLVGALFLSRATAGTDLSGRILEAARTALLAKS